MGQWLERWRVEQAKRTPRQRATTGPPGADGASGPLRPHEQRRGRLQADDKGRGLLSPARPSTSQPLGGRPTASPPTADTTATVLKIGQCPSCGGDGRGDGYTRSAQWWRCDCGHTWTTSLRPSSVA